jgi:hypothetical protein
MGFLGTVLTPEGGRAGRAARETGGEIWRLFFPAWGAEFDESLRRRLEEIGVNDILLHAHAIIFS